MTCPVKKKILENVGLDRKTASFLAFLTVETLFLSPGIKMSVLGLFSCILLLTSTSALHHHPCNIKHCGQVLI